jgi:Fe-S-cluster containining protein
LKKTIEAKVLQLHKETFGTTDCKKCANCCYETRFPPTEDDNVRMAQHLGLGLEDFKAQYLTDEIYVRKGTTTTTTTTDRYLDNREIAAMVADGYKDVKDKLVKDGRLWLKFADAGNGRQSCIFLKNNECAIYEARPQACQDYPYTNMGDFGARLEDSHFKSRRCPALFQILERLRIEGVAQ